MLGYIPPTGVLGLFVRFIGRVKTLPWVIGPRLGHMPDGCRWGQILCPERAIYLRIGPWPYLNGGPVLKTPLKGAHNTSSPGVLRPDVLQLVQFLDNNFLDTTEQVILAVEQRNLVVHAGGIVAIHLLLLCI